MSKKILFHIYCLSHLPEDPPTTVAVGVEAHQLHEARVLLARIDHELVALVVVRGKELDVALLVRGDRSRQPLPPKGTGRRERGRNG